MKINKLIILIIFSIGFVSCEKNVTVNIPQSTSKIVVEGYVETGSAPIVLLTKSLPFFGEINVNNILQNSILGATVIVDNGIMIDTLTQIPGFGVYISNNMIGEIGFSYKLSVITNGETITALTTIPQPVSFDSTWWKVDGQRDSLGFLWGHLSDPDTLGNSYRIFTKRINHYSYGAEIGKVKDSTFFASQGSVFEDRYINGRSFDINFIRGRNENSGKTDDENDERFFFKRGDTVVVKFCSIDRAHFEFWRTEESQVGSNGNPFGSPQPVHSNINGGLGIWGGYSPTYDTVIAR